MLRSISTDFSKILSAIYNLQNKKITAHIIQAVIIYCKLFYAAFLFVASLITKRTATIITAPIARLIQGLAMKGAIAKFTKETAATVKA